MVQDPRFSDLGYPNQAWNTMLGLYYDYDELWSGSFLDEKTEDGKDLYPVKLNPFRLPITINNAMLFGDVPEDSSAAVGVQLQYEDSEAAEAATRMLDDIWSNSNGRELQYRAGLSAQKYGGAVLGVMYRPELLADGLTPVEFTYLDVAHFYPAWRHNSNELLDVLVAYRISRLQAEALGVPVDTYDALYTEKWTRKNYEIAINGNILELFGGVRCEGRPVGGVIPYVYIPHPPIEQDGFYGTSMLYGLTGLGKEFNIQTASIGDIVMERAANVPAVTNAREIRMTRVGGRKAILDLGMSQGDRKPEIFYPSGQSSGTLSSADEHVDFLLQFLRNEMYCPPVLMGADANSQRSTSSFAFLALNLINHVREERAAFTSGLIKLNRNALLILAEKKYINTDLARKSRILINWHPVLPRDKLQESTSIIQRVYAGLLSPETAISMLGDVLDIQAELDKIKSTAQQIKTEPKGLGADGELREGDTNV